MNPKVPGSRNTGSLRTGISSPARWGSTDMAPTKVKALRATKKKRAIFGGWPGADSGPVSEAHNGRTAASTSRAILVVVSRL